MLQYRLRYQTRTTHSPQVPSSQMLQLLLGTRTTTRPRRLYCSTTARPEQHAGTQAERTTTQYSYHTSHPTTWIQTTEKGRVSQAEATSHRVHTTTRTTTPDASTDAQQAIHFTALPAQATCARHPAQARRLPYALSLHLCQHTRRMVRR